MLVVLPSSLSSVVTCAFVVDDGVGANENIGGVKLIDDAEPVNDFSMFVEGVNIDVLNVD